MSEIKIKPIDSFELKQFEWTGGKAHLQYFKEALKSDSTSPPLFLGSWIGEEAVGRIGIDFEKNPGKATLWMFNVRDSFRGKGIGTLLMDAAEAEISFRGINEIILYVEDHNNRAQELYLRRGYLVTGTGEESWEEDQEDGTRELYTAKVVIMSKVVK